MQWHVDTKCLGGLDIDDELEFCLCAKDHARTATTFTRPRIQTGQLLATGNHPGKAGNIAHPDRVRAELAGFLNLALASVLSP
jgi:hypothetical protein